MAETYVVWFDKLRMTDVESVGGKNASLGEMISQLAESGVRVPGGFATTAQAYRDFLAHDGLSDRINAMLAALDVDNVVELARVGKEIRQLVIDTPFPPQLEAEVRVAYEKMVADANADISVAVRSSATAEDLPDASFAGQQETFLNIRGYDNVKEAIHHVFASLYNDRAIAYRVHKGFAHDVVALSAGIQRMVRSDVGASGVMFTIDTESGFDKVVFVTASYGLGETVVQGAVNPDEFYVHKPTLEAGRPAILKKNMGSKLIKMEFTDANQAGRSVRTLDVEPELRRQFSITDAEVEELARYAQIIEKHYARPMDIEWGRDGIDGKLYILQARPETVKSQENRVETLRRYRLKNKSAVLAEGRAIGQKIGQGVVRLIQSAAEMDRVKAGDVLVTDMTDPDWEPVMKRAAAIVTNRGGRTCHAAIIARELGIPAVVGCGDATDVLKDGMQVTVSCAEGDTGNIYDGLLDIEVIDLALDKMPESPVKIMMNVGNPELAFDFAQLPNEGVGLARMEFIINRQIGIHPKALLEIDSLPSELQATIRDRISGYASPVDFYVDKIAEGVSTIAAAFYPKKVIVRMSDFKSNEYANLIGGSLYEPHEENPMIGFRGAARYIAPEFRDCFELECRAIRKVRETMGLTNVEVMIPFVRTLTEAAKVVDILKDFGLERGKNGLRLIMMCELPTNAVLAEQYLEYFDGFSIGSNDMTQLTLGVDRDSGGPIAPTFDERDPAVKAMLSMAIRTANRLGKYVGICGQGPSDHPDFAKWLMDEGIHTLSLNPDTVVETWLYLAKEAGK
ncbi:phosphoenolpyruvate synthase [Laribacter hongkongensis]|uniref:Phosphoenolpyruvate synthase n=1 Tax=Laribacter hongkongensis TaxID=168471 RepID=A0A248LL83_9NEIS|nr:phosphoenolpyruvate synthase [Laribacter hongkongensis]ASJ25527.1 phosphoenolpyruvate synthase [Laribacter hongkongensis]MCG8992992.1 phosphoenolpyruvate synthase [Laribacter hongkongensis]MCG8999591.1 phosphoenolpyruvate synthase [Laribacter hongkongensis]MCG9001951.1 phosphoenolpyruvate synthase [Laribacter hongkongensis]MCG9005089.1 phosphoenolpyruvate synthase [Laribacter hongkongensis]